MGVGVCAIKNQICKGIIRGVLEALENEKEAHFSHATAGIRTQDLANCFRHAVHIRRFVLTTTLLLRVLANHVETKQTHC
jgi:hypothetical protein